MQKSITIIVIVLTLAVSLNALIMAAPQRRYLHVSGPPRNLQLCPVGGKSFDAAVSLVCNFVGGRHRGVMALLSSSYAVPNSNSHTDDETFKVLQRQVAENCCYFGCDFGTLAQLCPLSD
uniref:IlGF domain-containing protein n=1 Tax=Panagrellus redivivus TaxID=6233 RepID=A0A7E4V630_PANRE